MTIHADRRVPFPLTFWTLLAERELYDSVFTPFSFFSLLPCSGLNDKRGLLWHEPFFHCVVTVTLIMHHRVCECLES